MRRVAAFSALVLVFVAGCSEDEVQYSSEAMLLPATLFDGLNLANELAREWSENAHLVRLGGGFTIMNAEGQARNHTYLYDARFGPTSTRRLTITLVSGMPWTLDAAVASLDPEFVGFENFLDSDVAVKEAVNSAKAINNAYPDSIPIPEIFAARLASVNVWPERQSTVPESTVAWRVDFLEQEILQSAQVLVYWSTARFYFDPETGEAFGHVVPAGGREVYPNNP